MVKQRAADGTVPLDTGKMGVYSSCIPKRTNPTNWMEKRMSMRSAAGTGLTVTVLLLFLGLAACSGGKAPHADASADTAGGSVDACALLTKADASGLFGEPASSDQTSDSVPGQLGKCAWHWKNPDPKVAENKGLQLIVWSGPQYYSAPDGSEPLQIGDHGYIQAHGPFKSVNIGWVQNGKTYSLVYSHDYIEISSGATNHTPDSIDKIKDLAKTISGRA